MTKIIRKPFEILEKTSTLGRDFVQEFFLEGLMQKSEVDSTFRK